MKRSYDNFHYIDMSPMLNPDGDVEITFTDMDDGSAFDEAGYYHRIVKTYNKRSWKFKYAVLTKEEFVYLHSLIKAKSEFMFSFVNEFGRKECVRAYCTPLSVVHQSKRSDLYKNLTLEIIEC